ncbi:MAG: 4-hydroxybutyrate CoA-transferase [Acidimicrobiaceae bacterium]|nr:4-hydroxybutyrate CoA-transferase [Acidimicrobiaceae bacterium]
MQIVSESEIGNLLQSIPTVEPRLVVSGNYATPWTLVQIADQSLERCRAFILNPQLGWPLRTGFITETPFVGPGVRNDPNLDYLPMRLSLAPRLFASLRRPDVVMIQTSTPRDGKVSLGIEVNVMPAAVEEVRRRGGLIVAQINRNMPYTRGDGEIPIDYIDFAIEVESELASPQSRILDDAAQAIGEAVGHLAVDGGTLQVGIGQLPDASVAHMLDKRDMSVWSEMVSDGVLQLERGGVLRKSEPIVTTFLFGTPELYEWADDNERLLMLRTEVVNSPSRIAAHRAMLSINTALEVDLFDQANASFVRGRIYSGFGGQPDFVIGALHSPGGHAVLALRSWHDKSDSSNIVPVLHDPACSFQHSMIVTEQGVAAMFGRSQHAQAHQLIENAAHPCARPMLREAAASLGLLRPQDPH